MKKLRLREVQGHKATSDRNQIGVRASGRITPLFTEEFIICFIYLLQGPDSTKPLTWTDLSTSLHSDANLLVL